MAGNAIDIIWRSDASSVEAAASKVEALSKRQADAVQRAADRQVKDNDRFIASIQRQVDTFGLSGAAMLQYEAKMRGVTASAQPLINRLNELKAAQAAINSQAGTTQMATGFQAAAKAVSASLGEIQKGAAIAQTALLGIGGALSLRMFAGVIEGAVDAKVKLLALSTQTGISVEALSGLGKVGKFANTDLDTISAASNRLSKALFTQNEDSKGAAQALQALGLNFAEFKAMKAEEQFVAVAKSMAEFEDGTAKSAAAMLLYGKTGATLLPFLKELEERGYSVGKQTTASAVQAKRYEESLIALKMSADAWKRTLAEAVLPTMIEVSDSFVSLRKDADSFNVVGAALKTGFETIAVLGANVSFVMQGIGREIGAIAAQANAVAHGDFAAASAIHDMVVADGKRARADLDETEKKYLGIKSRIGTAADFQRGDKDTSPAARKRLALEAPAGTAGVNAAQQQLENSFKKLVDSLGEEKVRLDANTESWRKYGRAIGDSKEAETRFSIDQGKLTGKGGASLTEAQKNAAMQAARDVDASKRAEEAQKLNVELDNRVKRLAAATNAQAMNSREVEIANDMAAAEKAGLIAGTAAMEAYRAKIVQTVNAEHDRALGVEMRNSSAKIDEQVRKLQAESDAIGAGTLARLQLVEALRIEDEARKRLLQNPGSQAQIETEAAIEKAKMSAAIAANYSASRAFESGSKTAFQKYQEDAGNAAAYAEKMMSGSFQHIEDALVNFVHTGKLSFSSLFTFMADEFLRNTIRMEMASLMNGGARGGIGGVIGSLGGAFLAGNTGLATGVANALPGDSLDNLINVTGGFGTIPLATGTNYVPYDGMQATLHKGEAVVPAAFNPAAGGKGGGHTFDSRVGTINVGQGVSRGEVQAAIAQAMAAQEQRNKRLSKQGLLQ